MLLNVMSDFCHRLADVRIGSKQVMMFACLPISESWQLLGDGLEETNNNTDRSRFHISAKLVNSRNIRNTVMTVELHFLPDSK